MNRQIEIVKETGHHESVRWKQSSRKIDVYVLQPGDCWSTIMHWEVFAYKLGTGACWPEDYLFHSYPAKLSAMMSLSYCTFLEWSTSTDCINFGGSLILAQRSVNRLWNHEILLLTVAKNKAVAAGGNLFPNSTLQWSHSEIAWICVYFSPQGERRTWPFVKLGHPSSGSGSEGATQA